MGLRQASMVNALTLVQYDIIYNCTSLGLASMMASTVFFFLRMSSFSERYKAALCFTGLVTFIAAYHYFRIFNSFVEAYTPWRSSTVLSTLTSAMPTPSGTHTLDTHSTMPTDMLTGSLLFLSCSSRLC